MTRNIPYEREEEQVDPSRIRSYGSNHREVDT